MAQNMCFLFSMIFSFYDFLIFSSNKRNWYERVFSKTLSYQFPESWLDLPSLDLPMYETNFLILFHCAYRTREWSPPLPSLFVWWIVDYNIVVLAELGRASIMRTTAQRTKIQKFIQKFKIWLLANNSYHTQCLTTERKLKGYLKYMKMIKIPLCKFLDKILNN